ncbi:fatty acyl-AMP ligase [Streptomyces cinnamoneus]|uniref:fatty acyl-AMP ligase n=1 Tax=Streptomyces cinnamoneus TaxID=53446 RepID=UPI0015E46E44|nr:fatty acyl-AMP ligase [Streptomyces cinnamoneus]
MTCDLSEYRNVGEAFTGRVAAHPGRTALTIHRASGDAPPQRLTFAQLAARAQARARHLGERLAPGERVLLALPTGTEFVEVYLACLFAGLVAVPVPAPGGSTTAADRVTAIARDCAPALAVTVGDDREALAVSLREHGLGPLPVEAAPPVEDAGPFEGGADAGRGRRDDARVPGVGRDTLAVLQYSSGSTGDPKGVMLEHGHILANTAAFQEATGLGPDDSFGIWMPLHHDMGLFGQLTAALLLGAPIVLMPAADFLRRPMEWFRMIDRYRLTVTAAPDFAYELCARLATDDSLGELDLSSLRVAFDGSEPIHVPTMTAFTERFARAGLAPGVLCPAYGMAEATVFASTHPVGTPPTVLTVDPHHLESAGRPALRPLSDGPGRQLTGVGRPRTPEIRIVDPDTRHELPAGAIGEVWLRGPNVGRGYWNQPGPSARVFAARLADAAPGDGGWLRTGDLGALLDGELFVTGRLKELLIVRGRNLFPQDIEQRARAAHEALTGFFGAAFGVQAPDERIVLVHEVSPKVPAGDLPTVATTVARELTLDLGVPVRNVVLVRRGAVRRTTSGKIKRAEMRQRFLTGGIAALHAEVEPAVRRLAPSGAGASA